VRRFSWFSRSQVRTARPFGGWRVLFVAGVVLLSASSVAIVILRSGQASAPGGPSNADGTPTPFATLPVSAGSATPSQPVPALTGDACAASTVAALSLEGKVGQLLMIGTPIANPTSVVATVRQYRLGGVFLAGRSSQSSATLLQSVKAIQQAVTAATAMPAQIALDQEGGLVQTLSGKDFPTIPSALQQGRWDAATLRSRTSDWARRLATAGVTMDLAPVADTVPSDGAASNPPIGALDRQYGPSPDAVAQDIAVVVEATQSAGVMTTLKHFPGLGRVRQNTDTSTHAVDNVTTAGDSFLRPFIEGIRAGSGAVMISSAMYPQLDSQSIAAFSAPIITGLLRQRLGFTGVIVSDDLGAAAAVSATPVGDRAVKFIKAGGDLALTVRQSDAGPMVSALLTAARQSAPFAARVTDAAEHVVRSKVRAGMLACTSTDPRG
jgi:beta-N-acetylhexosaminidase